MLFYSLSSGWCCWIVWKAAGQLSHLHTVNSIKSQEIHAPLNGVSTTPIILILACCHAESILISSPNTLAPFVVSFVDYYNDLSPHPCHHPLPHSCIKLQPISQFDCFSAFLLDSDYTQWYPMHMKHNGASKTLLLLIDGVFQIRPKYNVNYRPTASMRPLLNPGAAHDRRAAAEPSHWVRR
jgi:hypothetical protein